MQNKLLICVIAWFSGLLFSLGLIVGDMISPARVQAFFQLGLHWDPALIFVMIGALIPSFFGQMVLRKFSQPVFDQKWHFSWERIGIIDKKLLTGSILFGIGWAISGLCPGPAFMGIFLGDTTMILFFFIMLTSMAVIKYFLLR